MHEDRLLWDRRYAEGISGLAGRPIPYLVAWLPHLPRGRALDLAAGCGRHALYLARHGYRVHALDISRVALAVLVARARARALPVSAAVVDLDEIQLPAAAYDLIVKTYYLNRALLPQLARALVPGGALLMETRLYDPDRDPPERSARRPRPGELAQACAGLEIAHYEELPAAPPRRPAGVCRLVAFRPSGRERTAGPERAVPAPDRNQAATRCRRDGDRATVVAMDGRARRGGRRVWMRGI